MTLVVSWVLNKLKAKLSLCQCSPCSINCSQILVIVKLAQTFCHRVGSDMKVNIKAFSLNFVIIKLSIVDYA